MKKEKIIIVTFVMLILIALSIFVGKSMKKEPTYQTIDCWKAEDRWETSNDISYCYRLKCSGKYKLDEYKEWKECYENCKKIIICKEGRDCEHVCLKNETTGVYDCIHNAIWVCQECRNSLTKEPMSCD